MIKEVEGDILLSGARAIAHGVAPNDHFDSGLALALRERWPAMHKDFRHYCHTTNPSPGELWTWGGPGGVRIINLFTQEPAPRHAAGHPGRASLEHVRHCLRALRKLIDSEGFSSVALPRLATGVGGLAWADVEPLIRERLSDVDSTIIIYSKYHPNQRADEGL